MRITLDAFAKEEEISDASLSIASNVLHLPSSSEDKKDNECYQHFTTIETILCSNGTAQI